MQLITPKTFQLTAGSPAIDAVTDGTRPPSITDQQGVRRPQDGNGDGGPAYDIGAYEFVFIGNTPLQASPQPVIPTPPQPKAPAPTACGADPLPSAPTPLDHRTCATSACASITRSGPGRRDRTDKYNPAGTYNIKIHIF
jgi:hypothetical protein